MKKNGNNTRQGQYYLGLDAGTNSVGWAVTDKGYNVLRFKGNAMWGIRLFNEAQDASERRIVRTNRRRLERRKQRLLLLELLFSEEIQKADPLFFLRLKESNLCLEDKNSATGKYCVFNDSNYKDADYLKDYPTIYHLRSELVHSNAPHDIRLVYMALHHLIKYRGHFLYAGGLDNSAKTLDEAFDDLNQHLEQKYDTTFSPEDFASYKTILTDKAYGITQKKSLLKKAYGKSNCEALNLDALSDMLSGAKVSFANLFNDPEMKNAEINSLSLKSDLDDNYDELCEALGEHIDLILLLKAIFDIAREAQILGDEIYLSDAKKKLYEQNGNDLNRLKEFVHFNAPEKYKLIFSTHDAKINNYAAYSGYRMPSGFKECSQEDFCNFLKKTLPELGENAEYADINLAITEKTFLTKLKGSENGVISYQLQKRELMKILDNASAYLPFLNTCDDKGISVKQKIISIFEYKIPYYVGPLNTASKKSWVVRSDEKIYPWNFNDVVDLEKSAEEFITKLVSRCTYTGDIVIPKDSLLYSEFTVLNEINPLKINGTPLPVEEKQKLVQALFVESKKKVTKKKIADYLLRNGLMKEGDELSGIDDTIKSSLSSYHDFKRILQKTQNIEMVESIIRSILIFGEDKKMLKNWLNKNCKGLDNNDITYICRLKYKDWGRFSREFLEGIYDIDEQGEIRNIMDYLRNSNLNIMQLLTDSYDFAKLAEEKRKERIGGKESLSDRLDAMYIAPTVRRSVRQALRIVDEITGIMKSAPAKIFIEVTRGNDDKKKGQRTQSRKEKLLALYTACGMESDSLFEKLQGESDMSLRRDKLYLYYTQFGKCMYSGELIDLHAMLQDNKTYDIDHIFPRSRIKDDSIDNRVLVKSTLNRDKTNIYPIAEDIRTKMLPFWTMLKEKDLISQKKYERLKRSYSLTDKELSEFVSRQIVETSQSVKALATLMSEIYPETQIVYSKASNVSDFKEVFKFIKCREVNDLHHAKDAYLNIVVGNVYHTRFTEKFFKNIRNENYSLSRVFDFTTEGAWKKDETIKTVRKQMEKNNILMTRMPYESKGKISKLTILPATQGQLAIKQGRSIEKYGGYDTVYGAYFAVIEHQKGKKRIRTVEPVYIYKKALFENDPIAYCEQVLGLEKPTVICNKILMDALLEINGMRMNITGRTGKQNVYKHTYQLKLDADKEKYIKALLKYTERCAKAKSELPLTSFDGISKEENIALYDWFATKLNTPVYKALFKSLIADMEDNREKFAALSVLTQSKLLLEILKAFKCDRQCPNFSELCGKGKVGELLHNTNISNDESVYLINQSITGLYETKMDLLH